MDILHIPGDTGGNWRLNKFMEFHHKVSVVDHTLLSGYAQRNILTNDELILLFWLHSVVYSEITAIYVFQDIKEKYGWENVTPEIMNKYWEESKPILQFGSARRYAKSLNWFPGLIIDFMELTNRNYYDWVLDHVGSTPEESYDNLWKSVTKIKYTGRFAADLFMQNFAYFYFDGVLDLEVIKPFNQDWRNHDNETSGLLNIFYKDEEANIFDKTGHISDSDCKFLDEALLIVQENLRKSYTEEDSTIIKFLPRVCTFRNFCKGMRYVGFHHDRQLRFINQYIKQKPDDPIWEQIFEIRKSIFPNELLGELNGWNDIRPERKKMFLTTGNTGAEIVK